MTTPPHLAELTLTTVTPERTDEYLAAVLRGFHSDYKPEHWEPHKAVFEPERNFGFAADGRWISSTGAYTATMVVPGGSVPVAAVTLVTVSPAYRRRGLLRAMMTHQLTEIAERGVEPVALLWASEHPIYGRYGYGEALARLRLSGPTQTLGFAPGVDFGAGSVGEVEREEFLSVAGPLREGWLADRPGALARPAAVVGRPAARPGGLAAGRVGVPVRPALRRATDSPTATPTSGSRRTARTAGPRSR